MEKFAVRNATEKDSALILYFIKELAEYEKMSSLVVATEKDIKKWLFEDKTASVIFAMEDGKEVGFALYFLTFSTFLGRPGIHLEDLFVIPQYRGHGHGKALLRHLARISIQNGYGRLEWSCLDWNTPSIDFYTSIGAEKLSEWIDFRVSGETLEKMAED